MEHELKTWPEYFEAIIDGTKPFELRRNDRNFAVGDTLRLREYDPNTNQYSGRECTRGVSYMLQGDNVLPGFCVLGLSFDRAALIDETTRWSNAVRKLEAERREDASTITWLRNELGGLYADIFGDGGHRQHALDRLPNRVIVDELFGGSMPHRVAESTFIFSQLVRWAGPALVEAYRRDARAETQSYTGLADCPTCAALCVAVDNEGDVIDCPTCAGRGEVPRISADPQNILKVA